MLEKKDNDKIILDLKNKIEEKKKTLKITEKFSPITNCSIELDGTRYNIHALNKELLTTLLVKLNSYKLSIIDLELSTQEYNISGFPLNDWIQDVYGKLMNVNRKDEENRLKSMELRLHNLLSNEKKVELEINEIAKFLE
jgi:hypothetical protein